MDGILLYEHLVWLVPAKNADTVSSRLLRCLHASKAPNLGRQQKKMRRKWLRQEETKHKRGQEETKNIVSSYTTSKIGALTMARASNWFIDASFEKEWKVNEFEDSVFKCIYIVRPVIRTCALLYKSFVMDFEVTGGKVTVVRAPQTSTGNPCSLTVPHYRSSKITVFVWGKNMILIISDGEWILANYHANSFER